MRSSTLVQWTAPLVLTPVVGVVVLASTTTLKGAPQTGTQTWVGIVKTADETGNFTFETK